MVTRPLLLVGLAFGILGCGGGRTPTAVVPVASSPTGGAQGANQDPGAGRNAILQRPFDQLAKAVLLKVGYEYRQFLALGTPPKSKSEFESALKTRRDGVDHEIEVLLGVDPSKLDDNGSKHRLAWEKDPDAGGGRMVLMADCVTVNYLNEEQFKNTPRAK